MYAVRNLDGKILLKLRMVDKTFFFSFALVTVETKIKRERESRNYLKVKSESDSVMPDSL